MPIVDPLFNSFIFICLSPPSFVIFFFFKYPAPPEIYTLSLHDALPISPLSLLKKAKPGAVTNPPSRNGCPPPMPTNPPHVRVPTIGPIFSRWKNHGNASPPEPASSLDRKSTRLNSSHSQISYAVFCLKK